MIGVLLLLAGQVAAPVPASEPEPDEIVVTASRVGTRWRCRVQFEDRTMSNARFRRRAAEWAAGRPVRVVAPAETDLKCLSRIAFRLADQGVRRITFVEP